MAAIKAYKNTGEEKGQATERRADLDGPGLLYWTMIDRRVPRLKPFSTLDLKTSICSAS
jgi:hypothetical protein